MGGECFALTKPAPILFLRIERVATVLANSPAPRETVAATPVPSASLRNPLHLWHLLSLDAPTVAVVWAWAFAWTVHIELPVWPLAVLALVVWSIYVFDRLLDARDGQHDLRERHYFHWRYRFVLAPLAAIAGLVAAWLVRSRMPALALPQDSAVALATLAYFSGVHARRKLPRPLARLFAAVGSRECMVGALFAAGCVLPAWSVRPAGSSLLEWLAVPVGYFAALAWLNVRAISSWESPSTERDWIGPAALGLAVLGLAAAGLLSGLAGSPDTPRAAALLAMGAGSALLLGVLHRRRDRIGPVTLRAAVDLVLLTPLLLAPVALGS